MTRGRSAAGWFAGVVLAAVVVSPSSALASSDPVVVEAEVPPVRAVVQVDVPPVTVPVVDARLDQVLPPVALPVSLPPLQQLLPPLSQSLPAAAPPAAAATAAPPLSPAQGPVPSEPVAGASSSGPLPREGPAGSAVAGYGSGPRPGPRAFDALTRGTLDTAGRFWFPLATAAVVMVFVVVQWFVDRRDPKLSASPLSDELLGFT